MKKQSRWMIMMVVMMLGIAGIANLPVLAEAELQTETTTFEVGSAKTANVSVNMKAGELKVSAGRDALLDATFTYNLKSWQPRVDYAVYGSKAVLELGQPSLLTLGADAHNEWDLRLTPNIPLNLSVKMWAGEGTLSLRGLKLNRLEVESTAGKLKVDLTGSHRQNLDVSAHCRFGALELYLPEEVGVYVKTSCGIGEIQVEGLSRNGSGYVNDAYGKSDITILVDAGVSIGSITLKCKK